ncbi:hypothetical protein PF005_g20917 [Phytophthora fragariae]|uniref:ER membrane protein complex subunit 7 beta-sandwich domain-containing protein n=1 Tax=Phytophthora fragariae TaxID=53985 RepID=A0A6A3IZD9_9STRA|nr:hypothetical protein PF003_g9429 [Phytophthora fragariae]KAE8927922.1 hypothetical protein PF009_g21913 [Phytophthora fragariae]KAE8987421.1 hypothetical protein PF011_g19581 [Phytophthora fragariae]KAE9086008.1 hypothetical protein PF007_g20933 [Phytophthora fragariae]KAE9086145.1 hypothetical protein PF010_g20198 [Phytophthora fragariae]
MMTMSSTSRLCALLALLLAACAQAFEISGTVYPLGSVTEQVAPLQVQLNGGERTAFVRSDGAFVFRDVAPGRYVVDIPSTQFLFSQFKVDVGADGLIRALEFKYPGAPKTRANYPLVAEAVKELDYFEQREKFNLLGMIMSPSFLTIIVPIGLLYLLPKLSEGMDPEEMKKAQEEMGSTDPSSLLAGMLGGGQTNADDSDDD